MASPDTAFAPKPGDLVLQHVQPDGSFLMIAFRRTASRVIGWGADGKPAVMAPGTGDGGTLSNTLPAQLGTRSAGAAAEASRADHVHPTPFADAAVANNAGNETITLPSAFIRVYSIEATVGGSARTTIFVLDPTGAVQGARIKLGFDLPGTAGIAIQVRNAATDGTQVYDTLSTADARRVYAEFKFNGTAWVRDFAVDPA